MTKEWYFKIANSSHLSYTIYHGYQCKVIVKVHGVLPSSREYSASSRRIQFHWVHVRDSRAIVTPFMQVATYATRNFATLEPLELRLPFTGALIRSFVDFSFSPSSTGQVSDSIHRVTT